MKTKPLHPSAPRASCGVDHAGESSAEKAVEATLPPMAGLLGATLPEREATYQQRATAQRAAWVAKHGSLFGSEADAPDCRYRLPEGMRQAILASAPGLGNVPPTVPAMMNEPAAQPASRTTATHSA